VGSTYPLKLDVNDRCIVVEMHKEEKNMNLNWRLCCCFISVGALLVMTAVVVSQGPQRGQAARRVEERVSAGAWAA
jgi:hypothetical protein